jgi:hypothetical protein
LTPRPERKPSSMHSLMDGSSSTAMRREPVGLGHRKIAIWDLLD